MIPRRDVTIYGGLSKYIFIYLKSLFYKKEFFFLFKKSLQKYFSKEDIFLFNYGRNALAMIFKIVEIKEGDEIIIPNYYLKELVPLIENAELSPIFCDIDKEHLSLNLEKMVSKITPKTKFVLLVHMFGICQDMDKFIEKVREVKKDIIIIEDCAHAFGSEYKDKKLGTFGDFSFFSFNYIKPLNLLSGGLLFVNSKKYKERAEKVYKEVKKSSALEVINKTFRYSLMRLMLKPPLFILIKFMLRKEKTKRIIKKIHKTPSEKIKVKRLSDFQSMLGYYQLKVFDEKQNKIKKVLEYYRKHLSPFVWKKQPAGNNSKWSKYFLTFITEKPSKEVEEFMFKNKIDIGIEDEVMDVCKENPELETSKRIYYFIFQVPLYYNFKEREVKIISDNLNKIFS